MQIDKSAWWYWIPAQFNERALHYRSPPDLCSLVRSLAWGWILTVLQGAMVCMAAGAFGYFLLGFWCAVLGLYDVPTNALLVLLFGGMLNAVLFSVVAVLLYNHYNVGSKLKPYLTRSASKDKPPGLISTWLKGLKDKTCVLVHYVD